jgi:hypothetical protein
LAHASGQSKMHIHLARSFSSKWQKAHQKKTPVSRSLRVILCDEITADVPKLALGLRGSASTSLLSVTSMLGLVTKEITANTCQNLKHNTQGTNRRVAVLTIRW